MTSGRCVMVLIVLAMLSGCAIAGPRVEVGHALLGEATDEATEVTIEVDLHNPRERPIELREMHYRVSIAGRRVYAGRRATTMTLAPREIARIQIPAIVTAENADLLMLGLAEGFSVSGSVEFVAPGRLALVIRDLGLPRPSSGFSGRGALELPPG